MAFYNLFRIIWRTEHIPKGWQESTVIKLRKGNLPPNNLNNVRHIHDRNQYLKVLGQMIMEEAKPSIFEHMPKFQIACRPRHLASEHLFVLKSLIAK